MKKTCIPDQLPQKVSQQNCSAILSYPLGPLGATSKSIICI